MESRSTHHSQLNCIAREQATGEHDQSQLQVGMARASSRRAKQAPGERSKLQVSMAKASSRGAKKLQEGIEQTPGGHKEEQRGVVEEKHLLDAQEIPPWHGEAVPARPRRHHARGSRR
jgi:hypothetical protein